MALDYPGLLGDLREETALLLDRLAALGAAHWAQPTPAAGWSVTDQVSHLAYFDDAAVLAITDPRAFRGRADALAAGGMDFPDRLVAQFRSMPADQLLEWFSGARRRLLEVLEGQDPKRRLPWFGPDMSVASSATARLMETWAHGRDVYDTVGVGHPSSGALRHIAHLGIATFGFAHASHGLAVPTDPVRVELVAPSGEEWTWGPEGAVNSVSGPAEDFVLVVTQRRHWTKTAVTARGPVAREWLEVAQAFAGAPTRRTPQAADQ